MNSWMKKSMVATVVALTSVTLAGAALADGHGRKGGEGQRGGWHQMSPEKLMERSEKRLEQLESRLEITDAQQDAWSDYRANMLERAERMAGHMQERRGGERERPATVIERLEYMETRGEARLEALREMRVTTEALYAELSDEQREVFDAQHRGKRGEGRKAYRGKHGGGRES